MLYPSHYGKDPLFPDASDFAITNVDAVIGRAVVALRSFKKATVIAKMAGEVVPEVRQHTLEIGPGQHHYDRYFSGYFMHSCSPNIQLDMKNMLVIALRNIEPYELLAMDYAQTESYLFRHFECRCGHTNCRKWIVGHKETSLSPSASDFSATAQSGQ